MPWPKIRRTIQKYGRLRRTLQKIGHEAGSPIRSLTHLGNNKLHLTYGLFNFVVGPCANVFLMNQIRAGDLWSGFSSTSGGITAAQIAGFSGLALAGEVPKKINHLGYERMIKKLSSETATTEEAREAWFSCCSPKTQFSQTVINQANALVHGENMTNCVVIPFTLLDVYSKFLTDNGMIASNTTFGCYVGLTIAGFLYFYAQRYTENCDYNEQKMLEFFACVWDIVKRSEPLDALYVVNTDEDGTSSDASYNVQESGSGVMAAEGEQEELIPHSQNRSLLFKTAVEQVFTERNLIDENGKFAPPKGVKPYDVLSAVVEKMEEAPAVASMAV